MSIQTEDVESIWETMATSIDRAGPQHETLFLSKLSLLLIDALGDRAHSERLIEQALADLE